jgi:hypothetical protein
VANIHVRTLVQWQIISLLRAQQSNLITNPIQDRSTLPPGTGFYQRPWVSHRTVVGLSQVLGSRCRMLGAGSWHPLHPLNWATSNNPGPALVADVQTVPKPQPNSLHAQHNIGSSSSSSRSLSVGHKSSYSSGSGLLVWPGSRLDQQVLLAILQHKHAQTVATQLHQSTGDVNDSQLLQVQSHQAKSDTLGCIYCLWQAV